MRLAPIRLLLLSPPKLTIEAVNHDWGSEICGFNEVQGIDITTDFLKKNGFEMLNKTMPELWIKPLGCI